MKITKRKLVKRHKTKRGGAETEGNIIKELSTAVDSITIDNKTKESKPELERIEKEFDEKVLPILKKRDKKAEKYYEKREKHTLEKLKHIEEQANKELSEIVNEYAQSDLSTQIASSYSARMNVIGESDIDYYLFLNPMDSEKVKKLSEILKEHGFKPGQSTDKYHSFEKKIDGVEVEFKIRDFNEASGIRGLHKYLDEEMPIERKKLLTYGKFLLKGKPSYKKFKMLYFNSAFNHVKNGAYVM